MEKINAKIEHVVLRWLRHSKKDLSDASYIIDNRPGSSALACWLYQQSVEKAIKAALTLEKIRFPRTHDLDSLRDMLPDGWVVKNKCRDLSDLTEWTINARYPGDWPEPPR